MIYQTGTGPDLSQQNWPQVLSDADAMGAPAGIQRPTTNPLWVDPPRAQPPLPPVDEYGRPLPDLTPQPDPTHYLFPNLAQAALSGTLAPHNTDAKTFSEFLQAAHDTATPAASPMDSFKVLQEQAAHAKRMEQIKKQGGNTVETMKPNLLWIDPNFTPKQPEGSVIAPFWPTADRVSDWLTGPPGRPQATDDPAYVRRLEGTIPLPGVHVETPVEQRNRLLSNAPWLARLLGN